MKQRYAAARGFTLLEMLVTLSLLAIMSLLTWQALDSTGRATERTHRQQHDNLLILSLLDQLEQDITQHALLESPYPNPAGQITSPNDPVLPRAIQWQDQQLIVTRLGPDGQRLPIRWRLQAQGLIREPLQRTNQEAGVMRLEAVERFQMRVWVPTRGWMSLREVPPGLQASGVEFLISVRQANSSIVYRKVVMLP